MTQKFGFYGQKEIQLVVIAKAELESIGLTGLIHTTTLAFGGMSLGALLSFAGTWFGMDELSDRANAVLIALMVVTAVLTVFFTVVWIVAMRAYWSTMKRAMDAPSLHDPASPA